MRISREFTFEAAHVLPNLPEGHKCGRLHGHSYRVVVWIEAADTDKRGFAGFDFAEIDEAWASHVHPVLDHSYLNDTFKNPTAEFVCQWIWARMEEALGTPIRIEFLEGHRSRVNYP